MSKILKAAAIILILSSCNAERRFNDYSIKHPDKFKTLAAVLAPCVDINPKSDTIFRSKTDTLLTPGNTVIERRNDTVFVTEQLPGRIITKTDVQTVTKTVEDSRMLDACAIKSRGVEDQLTAANQKITDVEHSRAVWMWIALGCIVGLLLMGYLWISGGGFLKLIK